MYEHNGKRQLCISHAIITLSMLRAHPKVLCVQPQTFLPMADMLTEIYNTLPLQKQPYDGETAMTLHQRRKHV